MLNSPNNKRLSPAAATVRASRHSLANGYAPEPEESEYLTRDFFPAFDEEYDDDHLDDDLDGYEDFDEILPAEDIRFLREFIVSSALYVEQLEDEICERSDEFWESREHAYRIITGLLIDLYRYEMTE